MENLLKIKFYIKKKIVENLNLINFSRSHKKNSLRVMMLHDTPEKDHIVYINQIKFLIKNGWKFLDPKQFIYKKIAKKKFYGKNLVITFDDGLKSNKIFAKKLKDKFGIKSIFFVPYEFIIMKKKNDIKNFCLKKLRLNKKNYSNLNLNFRDLKYLINNGHIIGSHTLSHPNLKKIEDQNKLNKEIKGSKKLLSNLLKTKINTFAFTYGTLKDINKKSLKLSLKYYDLVFTGIRGNNLENNKVLFRDEINSKYSLSMCSSFLDGNADFIYNNSRKKLLQMCNY